jgi:[acyl-carrier-protein] S-malonyltransferase
MSPASEGLESAIEGAALLDPGIPVIANSTSMPLTTAQGVREELLAQLCSCVQWKRSVCHMIESGVTSFIEFGPGHVLGGLIKRISSSPLYRDRGVEVLSVNNLDSARALAEALGPLGWSRRSLATS